MDTPGAIAAGRRDELIEAARAARTHAYAPYSGYRVGAALLASGRVFTGANVENASFSAAMCAERVAVGAAVFAGCTAFEALAVSVDVPTPARPCGCCRQVLAEFAPGLRLLLVGGEEVVETTLAELFPEPFSLEPQPGA